MSPKRSTDSVFLAAYRRSWGFYQAEVLELSETYIALQRADDGRFDDQRRRALLRIGEALHAARVSRAWSQERVALEAGISVITYITMERGFSRAGEPANPTLDTILRVIVVLNIDPASLTQSTTG